MGEMVSAVASALDAEDFSAVVYYLVNIGDLLDTGRYQVVGKLGFGRSSTVWLARDWYIKADNILHAIVDNSILEASINKEISTPSPQRFVDGVPVYLSRRFYLPKDFGHNIFSDFGSTVRGDIKQTHDAQPDVYRAPEIMMEAQWGYAIYI
ncbi:hypothetical protein N0V88_007501 [Collariella sp. IMI 366227]|nr:hypothetical protein N0V88_007501 [Collariella sp. IMI 366227]